MENKPKSLIDNHEEGFIANESGTSIKTNSGGNPTEKNPEEKQENVHAEEGSKSDPQLTEFDGLKKGGVSPHVHEEDKPHSHNNDSDLLLPNKR